MDSDVTRNNEGEVLPWEVDLVSDLKLTPNKIKELYERREKSFDEVAQLENDARRKSTSDSSDGLSSTRKCSGLDCPNALTGDSGFCSDACRDKYWGNAKIPSRMFSLKEMQAKVMEWAKERQLTAQNVNRGPAPAVA